MSTYCSQYLQPGQIFMLNLTPSTYRCSRIGLGAYPTMYEGDAKVIFLNSLGKVFDRSFTKNMVTDDLIVKYIRLGQ